MNDKVITNKKMGLYISSGNQVVDQVGMMQITGNVIPQIWYKTILKKDGKPYHLAITLLADIVYWYRPIEVRDENTGMIVGWAKKFKRDLLQRSYKQYADMYGESKKTVTAALNCLVEIGVVEKVIRKTEVINGVTYGNVMYLSLNANKLRELTYPQNAVDISEKENNAPEDPIIDENNISDVIATGQNTANEDPIRDKGKVVKNKEKSVDFPPITQMGTREEKSSWNPSTHLGDRVPPNTQIGNSLLTKKEIAITSEGKTNTKIKENTTKNNASLSLSYQEVDNDSDYDKKNYESMEVYLKNKISYDCFSEFDQQMLDDIVDILIESVYVKSDNEKINLGNSKQADYKTIGMVKNIMDRKLTFGVMKYYLSNFYDHSNSFIRDVSKYHVKAIYKACLSAKSASRAAYKSDFCRTDI